MPILVVGIALVATAVIGLTLAEKAAHERFLARAARIKAEAGVQDDAPVTEQELSELPEPMARFMRFSGVLGKKRIGSMRLRHSGRFKPGANKPWMPIRGEYFLTTRRPSFMWYGKVRIAPGISVVAFDSYADGSGRMLVKALSVYTIVDDSSVASPPPRAIHRKGFRSKELWRPSAGDEIGRHLEPAGRRPALCQLRC